MPKISTYILITKELDILSEITIRSALAVSDEVIVGNNKNIVDYQYLKSISNKVKPASYGFDCDDMRSICNVLTDMRRKCENEWCLHLSVGEVLHEKDSQVILDAVNKSDSLAINMRYVNMVGNYVKEQDFINTNLGYETNLIAPHRQNLTRNMWFITHQIPDYIKESLDYVPYYDERTGWEFYDPSAGFIEDEYKFPVFLIFQDYPARSINAIYSLLNYYAYIWNYAKYFEPVPEYSGWLEIPNFVNRQPQIAKEIIIHENFSEDT